MSAEITVVSLEPIKPRCSVCLQVTRRVAAFLSRGMHHDGKPNMNRGGAWTVRICRTCARSVLQTFRRRP